MDNLVNYYYNEDDDEDYNPLDEDDEDNTDYKYKEEVMWTARITMTQTIMARLIMKMMTTLIQRIAMMQKKMMTVMMMMMTGILGKVGADEEVWPAGEQDVQQADGPAMEDAAAHMKQEPVLEGIDNNIKTNEPLQNTGVELVENVEVETINEDHETIDEDNEINDNVTENSAHGRYKLWGNCKPHYDHLKMQLASTWVDTLTISATTESLATPKCQGNRVFNILAR